MKKHIIRFFSLFLAVCFVFVGVTQPMSVCAADPLDSSVYGAEDRMLAALLSYYFSPYLVFDYPDNMSSRMYIYLSAYFSWLVQNGFDLNEYSDLLSAMDNELEYYDDGFSIGPVSIDFCNDFANFFNTVLAPAEGVEPGTHFDDPFYGFTYVEPLPVYDLDLWTSRVYVSVPDWELPVNNVHKIYSPVADSLNSVVSSVGEVALIAVGVGVSLMAAYLLIRLIRRIL